MPVGSPGEERKGPGAPCALSHWGQGVWASESGVHPGLQPHLQPAPHTHIGRKSGAHGWKRQI